MQALLLTSLGPKTTRDSAIEECRVYYPLSLKTLKRPHRKISLRFVRTLLLLYHNIVYSVVKLRLPDDLLMNALTDQVEAKLFKMTPKETALVSWALARSKLPADTPLTKKLVSAI